MTISSHKMTIVGVPMDCSGRATGVERMPVALRKAGLVQQLNAYDTGDLSVTITDSQRDLITGIIGFQDVCKASATIRSDIGAMLNRGEKPFVIGGCCTLLIGVFAALRDIYGEVGLAFVDGHLDFYDGTSSPTGEAADMELAILTGHGPKQLTELAGTSPLVNPKNVVVLGYRDAVQAAQDGALDPTTLIPDMSLYNAQAVQRIGPDALATRVAQDFAVEPGRFWLHIDLDVLDQDVLPAVDYLMPDGLNWNELTSLVRPLATSPGLIGVDVTIYNPTLDADGRYANRITELLHDVFVS